MREIKEQKQSDSVGSESEQLRRQTGQRSKTPPPLDTASLSPDQIEQMFCELKVRMIEFELQNEVLLKAKAQWEAEKALNIRLLESQFLNSPDIILVIDRQYRIEMINRVAAGDFTVEGLKGRDAVEVLPADQQGIVRQAIDRCFATGRIQEIEHGIGDDKWVRARIVPMADGAAISGLMIIATDISQRKQAEGALRQTEERLGQIIGHTPAGYFFIDRLGCFQAVNRAWLDMHGYESDKEVLGRHFALTQVEADLNAFQRIVKRLLSGDPIPSGEFSRRRRDGSVGYHTFSAHPVIQAGEVVGLEGFLIDTTERKLARQALLDKDAMLANIASQVPGMLYQFMMRPDGGFCVPYSSQGVEEIFGCTPEQVRDSFDPIFKAIHPDDRDKILQTIDMSVKHLSQWMCEYRVQLPGQPVKWIFGNSIPEKMADGGIVWSGYNVDITERMKAEEEKAKLQAHLQQAQKIESVGRLAGGVAHDFNNMLGVILGYAELAQGRVDPSDPLHADITEIITAAQRSARITRQLLAFARKQALAPVVLDLNIIVSGMHKMLERLIGEHIELSWHPAADLWPVKMDASQIDQILANLCINARDAISNGGKITIKTENCVFDARYCASHPDFMPGEFVRLAVTDDGIGMDDGTLAHIFEPFFTTKNVGEGTGLGLAMVYGAVQQHDGFVEVRSAPGSGTTFSIYLPKYTGEDAPVRTGAGPEAFRGGRETILLVEDESAVLTMTKKALERLGYTVLPAGTTRDALQIARMHPGPIHLLMTDVVMPEMNGPALYQQISALRSGIKCLFMSGYPASALGHHDQIDESIHFLQKPFTRQDLAVKLRVALST